MVDNSKITALRMERQQLLKKACEAEYIGLYRDTQPGQNVYWNGFGDPPSITYRADFDDVEYNRTRQSMHELIKGRFQGGNLGWIMRDDLELFAGLCKKPLEKPTYKQLKLLELIEHEGPLTIQHMKELTGMLVKDITPVLHRLQEAFLIYEDQYDGEWDRGWYLFNDFFKSIDFEKYSRHEALKIVLLRFAYRHVLFDIKMAKSFYKLPEKDIKSAVDALFASGELVSYGSGYMKKDDFEFLKIYENTPLISIFAIHKNDFLYKSNEHILKEKYHRDGFETLYYLLIDGEFCGAAYGKFRYGPPDFDDLRVDLPNSEAIRRRDEILEAVKILSFGKVPDKYNGEVL